MAIVLLTALKALISLWGVLNASKCHRRRVFIYSLRMFSLGTDLSFFDRVFTIEKLEEITSYLTERAGKVVLLSRTNISANTSGKLKLNNSSVEKLRQIYYMDYELLKEFY